MIGECVRVPWKVIVTAVSRKKEGKNVYILQLYHYQRRRGPRSCVVAWYNYVHLYGYRQQYTHVPVQATPDTGV